MFKWNLDFFSPSTAGVSMKGKNVCMSLTVIKMQVTYKTSEFANTLMFFLDIVGNTRQRINSHGHPSGYLKQKGFDTWLCHLMHGYCISSRAVQGYLSFSFHSNKGLARFWTWIRINCKIHFLFFFILLERWQKMLSWSYAIHDFLENISNK